MPGCASSSSISLVRQRLEERMPQWSSEKDGDYHLNPELHELIVENARKPAAVLIGLVERNHGTNVILTKRTEKLSSHSGQVAFPGGKIDETDRNARMAALREAQEEIGLDQTEVEVIGQLPDYHSGSGFLICPVVAEVSPSAGFEINPHEVEYMFEVPLAFLMDEANHRLSSREFGGAQRHYYEMPYQDHYIWGVTAGIIRVFHNRIIVDDAG